MGLLRKADVTSDRGLFSFATLSSLIGLLLHSESDVRVVTVHILTSQSRPQSPR